MMTWGKKEKEKKSEKSGQVYITIEPQVIDPW